MCDGFAGNVILKLTEGLIAHLHKWMSSKDEIRNNPEVMSTMNSIFNNYIRIKDEQVKNNCC